MEDNGKKTESNYINPSPWQINPKSSLDTEIEENFKEQNYTQPPSITMKNERRKEDRRKELQRYSDDEDLNKLLTNVVADLSEYAERMLDKIKKLSDIGRALSGEPEINRLLKMIVYENYS